MGMISKISEAPPYIYFYVDDPRVLKVATRASATMVFEEQTAGKGVVILFLIHFQKKWQNILTWHHFKLKESEKYQKKNNKITWVLQ